MPLVSDDAWPPGSDDSSEEFLRPTKRPPEPNTLFIHGIPTKMITLTRDLPLSLRRSLLNQHLLPLRYMLEGSSIVHIYEGLSSTMLRLYAPLAHLLLQTGHNGEAVFVIPTSFYQHTHWPPASDRDGGAGLGGSYMMQQSTQPFLDIFGWVHFALCAPSSTINLSLPSDVSELCATYTATRLLGMRSEGVQIEALIHVHLSSTYLSTIEIKTVWYNFKHKGKGKVVKALMENLVEGTIPFWTGLREPDAFCLANMREFVGFLVGDGEFKRAFVEAKGLRVDGLLSGEKVELMAS